METAYFRQEMHLKDYLHLLHRRRDTIIIFFLAVVLVVAAGSFIIRPVYRSIVTLLIDVESPNILTTSGSVELGTQSYFTYKEYFQSQMEIIVSRPIVKQVFDEFNLGQSRQYAKAKDPIKKFLKTINVEPVRDTRLLKLQVDNRSPQLAAKIANRIAEVYVKRNLDYISRNEILNLLKNEYLKLQTKLSEYSKIYKDEHPEMIKLKREIGDLVQKIEREKGLGSDYSASLNGISVADYKDALKGLKANNVSVVAAAEVPALPVRPNKLLNFFLAIAAGIFGGIGLAFFLEYLDDTVKDIEDIERLTNWPFLGCMPKFDAAENLEENEKYSLVHLRPKAPATEAYKSFRTKVALSSSSEHPLKCMVVTSLGPQEGKTTTICNLGIAMAQSQKRVLLVDADMRKSRLHEVFNKENESGLSTFLCGQAGLDGIVQKTGVDNLFLVTSGPTPPNPSELIASGRMEEFLSLARAKFDYILFDSPPVALLTDAVLLARATDGVIIVTESGRTSKKALLRSYKIIQDTKARVIGIFLNKISPDTGSNYYYYSYYSHYYGKEHAPKS